MPWKTRKAIPPGTRFGRWTVLRPGPIYVTPSGQKPQRHSTSVVRCIEGNERIVKNGDLKNGSTLSCGCLRAEMGTTHGQSRRGLKTQVYVAWQDMWQRCYKETNPSFDNYGGRGIWIVEEWRYFEAFFAFMGPGKKGWSIHRVDNDAGYFPENMVWALPRFQMRHTSRNRIVTVRGVTGCLIEVCEYFGKPYQRVSSRLNTLHWSLERSFFTPNLKPRR